MVETRIQGFWKVHRRVNNLKGIVGDAADDALHRAAKRTYREIVANASRRGTPSIGHRNTQLEALDHPFAKRKGSGSPAALGGDWAEKPWMVFVRSGKNVVRSIRYKVRAGGARGGEVVFHYRYTSDYVKYVVHGTKVMVARNVIVETLKTNERRVAKRFRKDFLFSWNRKYRKPAGIDRGFEPENK
jgi:hypothetical protein|tara:strand:+ start:1095 stop:1655 length:561 start_codon:yes stop_codon:yes gene_type:complete